MSKIILHVLSWLTLVCIRSRHFVDESSFDLVSSRGEPCPPLLLNWPRKARIYLSWVDFNYLAIFPYFCIILSSYFLRSFTCSSNPVFIFFCNAASSVACLALRVLRAVSILIFLELSHASFSLFSSYASLCWTLWA